MGIFLFDHGAGENRQSATPEAVRGVSLGDIAAEPRATDAAHLGEAIAEISQPSLPFK